VTVEAPKKVKKEKDYIFCIVFIIILFVIITDMLFLYAFKSAKINIIQEQYIRPVTKVSKYMFKEFKIREKIVKELKNEIIPEIDRMEINISCLEMDEKAKEKRIDSLKPFTGYTTRINKAFAAFEQLTLIMTEGMTVTKQIRFMSRLIDEEGKLKFLSDAGTINPIGKWNSKVCFMVKGTEVDTNAPKKTSLIRRRLAQRRRRLSGDNDM